MDTTVCMRSNASIPCGFRNVSDLLTPDWNISMRRNDGNIVINEFTVTHINDDNDDDNANGLDYIFDTVLGDNISPDSRLVVGPVDMADDQSSYQCIFVVPGSSTFRSNTGTLTVIGEYVIVITWARVLCLICMPKARELRAYISGKARVPML